MDGVVALDLFPDWVTRSLRQNYWAGPLWQPIPSTFRKCVWCKDRLPVFGPKVCRLGGHDLHAECNDKAVRFALKASIRNWWLLDSGQYIRTSERRWKIIGEDGPELVYFGDPESRRIIRAKALDEMDD